MVYNIVIGRDEKDRERFGERGTVNIGRLFVKMGQTSSLSNNILVDVIKTHVILIAGKRGSGKSTTAGVMAEEIADLPEDIRNNLAFLFFDTMGVFWTMKYPNTRQEELLKEWNLKLQGFDVSIFAPIGLFQKYRDAGIPVDFPFALKTSEMNASDWVSVFEIKLTESIGILIERVIDLLKDKRFDYSIKNIIKEIENDKRSSREIKDAAVNRFLAAERWGLFDENGTKIADLMKPGSINILDTSAYTSFAGNWSIKNLVIGIVCRKLLEERVVARKEEEIEDIKKEKSYFYEEIKQEKPLVWVVLDEGHEALPREGKTSATDALVQLLREGRQPGISLVIITQQPGEIHKDVLTQADIVISHRLTSQMDIEALNTMMQSYLLTDLQTYLNTLPKLKGAAIILDDNSERIYPIMVHPKRSWHGGEAPSALKIKQKLEIDLDNLNLQKLK